MRKLVILSLFVAVGCAQGIKPNDQAMMDARQICGLGNDATTQDCLARTYPVLLKTYIAKNESEKKERAEAWSNLSQSIKKTNEPTYKHVTPSNLLESNATNCVSTKIGNQIHTSCH